MSAWTVCVSMGWLVDSSFDRLPSTGSLRQAQDERGVDLRVPFRPSGERGLTPVYLDSVAVGLSYIYVARVV